MHLKKINRTRRALKARMRMRKLGAVRLSVNRSGRHIYAQVIDDKQEITLAAASSLEKNMREDLKTGGNVDAATRVGKVLAERSLAKGVIEVVFDLLLNADYA